MPLYHWGLFINDVMHQRGGGGGSRGQRFKPWSHPQWRIVEISNRPPNLSAKQWELTVFTKKSVKEKKTYQLRKKLYFPAKLPQNCQNLRKNCQNCLSKIRLQKRGHPLGASGVPKKLFLLLFFSSSSSYKRGGVNVSLRGGDGSLHNKFINIYRANYKNIPFVLLATLNSRI